MSRVLYALDFSIWCTELTQLLIFRFASLVVLPLCFPISFTLHNIPIGYKIFSITELHLYSMLSTKIKSLKNFNCTVISYKWKYCEHHYLLY